MQPNYGLPSKGSDLRLLKLHHQNLYWKKLKHECKILNDILTQGEKYDDSVLKRTEKMLEHLRRLREGITASGNISEYTFLIFETSMTLGIMIRLPQHYLPAMNWLLQQHGYHKRKETLHLFDLHLVCLGQLSDYYHCLQERLSLQQDELALNESLAFRAARCLVECNMVTWRKLFLSCSSCERSLLVLGTPFIQRRVAETIERAYLHLSEAELQQTLELNVTQLLKAYPKWKKHDNGYIKFR